MEHVSRIGMDTSKHIFQLHGVNAAEGIVTARRACGPSGGPITKGMKKISYSGYRFPPEIIHQAIWLYLRFTLSLRDVEDLLAERGVAVSYETVRRWVNHFGPMNRSRLTKASPEASHDLASRRGLSENRRPNGLSLAGRRRRGQGPRCAGPVPVSYTHLTLPTIYSV